MIAHADFTTEEIKKKIADGELILGGNRRLKIYGLLTCASGKRMKKVNRVFFRHAEEAIDLGFRPCGHCMHQAYVNWRNAPPRDQRN